MWLPAFLLCLEPDSQRSRRSRGHRTQAVTPRLVALEDRTVPSTFTVESLADSGPGSLRQAVLDANALAGADLIQFAPGASDGTIALTSGELGITDDLTIDGPGADYLSISGNNSSRAFDMSAGVTVTIDGLTIRNGLANVSSPVLPSTGGGILNFGNLTLADVVLSGNRAVGDPNTSPTGRVGTGLGGGVANLGTATLTISNSAFTGNQALGADGSNGNGAGGALGGAIASFATASVSGSRFTHNETRAGSDCTGSLVAHASSGGIYNNSGSLTVTNSSFSHNRAIGGNDSSGAVRPGFGFAAAILSTGSPAARLVVSASTFDHNQAIGGNGNQSSTNPAPSLFGPNSAAGGAIHVSAGTATISGCTIEHNAAIAGTGGAGQNGGLAWGGGLDVIDTFGFGVLATISGSTVSHNCVIGGAGGTGGDGGEGWGGGLANLLGATLTVRDSTVAHNRALGGAGGSGGDGADGEGGGIFQDELSTLTLTNATVEHNHAIGGAAGLGGSDGEGEGGGLYLTPGGTASADLVTAITDNHASTSADDVFGDLILI